MQRCENCKVSSNCLQPLMSDSESNTDMCKQACDADESCLMADHLQGVCNLYNCSEVVMGNLSQVFRKSCDKGMLAFHVCDQNNRVANGTRL